MESFNGRDPLPRVRERDEVFDGMLCCADTPPGRWVPMLRVLPSKIESVSFHPESRKKKVPVETGT